MNNLLFEAVFLSTEGAGIIVLFDWFSVGVTAMQMVKIQIADKEESAKAMLEMGRRGRVICLPDDVYVIPEPALTLLQSLAIPYQELGRGGFDYAQKTLRDASAAEVQ